MSPGVVEAGYAHNEMQDSFRSPRLQVMEI